MRAKTRTVSAGAIFFLLALALLPQFIGPDPAMAVRNYLISTNTTNPGFNVVYPTSTSGTNASCAICHATTGGGDDLNAYGEAWAVQHNSGLTTRATFEAIQGTNSDTDPTGATNIAEINASTQPGWTPGPHNTLYDIANPGAGTVKASNQNPPTVTGSLDPPVQNLPPVANAGPDQAVNVGQTVTLDGRASSDPNSDPLTYMWSFVLPLPAGSGATLSNLGVGVQPTFVADVAGSYTVRLLVNDGKVDSPPDTVVIAAAAQNLPPVANAGPDQAVNVGQTVTLDGSKSSDPNSDPLTYMWSFVLPLPAGSGATLSNLGVGVQPTFVADVAGSYTVRLLVNDGKVDSPPDTVVIAAAAQNLPPVANAGPDQAVNVGQTVTLDGSKSSDPNSDPLTYMWSLTKPAGSAATLSDASAQKPTFVADATGDYVAQLIVNDTKVDSPPDTVVIGAATGNQPPTANAGSAQTVTAGATVTLDGSKSSDPNSDPLTYTWSFVSKPAGSAATLSDASAQKPAFVADAAGQYVVGLVVNDNKVNSTNTANVVITVQAPTPTPACTMTVNPTALAFGSANVGSSKTMTTAIGNSGTANCTVSSLTVSGAGFALGSGAPSLPATVAPGATVNVPVNFAPTTAGTASGSLTIGSAVVSLSGTGATVTVPPPTTGAVDYDVRAFKATEEVELSKKQPVRLRLTVKNVGKVPGNAPATVVGMQNGSEVYRKTMAVFAPVGKTGTFDVPSYTPSAAGKIRWTVTIQDQGPARNTATATTEVKGEDKEETEHSDRKRS